MSITRTSAPLKAKQLAKQLRKDRPDYFYLKEIFKKRIRCKGAEGS